jgi:hypothetical protein
MVEKKFKLIWPVLYTTIIFTQVNSVRRETAGSHRFPVNSGDHIQDRFLFSFPAYFQPIPALGNGDRTWLSFPERFRNADPLVFYGDKIRIVSCRIRHPDLITKYNLAIQIPCFDFVSLHTDPKGYKLISWFISISDVFYWFLPVEIDYFSNNGTVYTNKRDGRSYRVHMVTPTEKVTNLKYELLMVYLDRDIDFLSDLSLLDPTFLGKSFFRISRWNFIHKLSLTREPSEVIKSFWALTTFIL